MKATTNEDVQNAIDGTPIGELVRHLSLVSEPPLPLELTLTKALVIAGSQAVMDNNLVGARGPDRLRLKIPSAGGLATNVFGLIVAPCGIGKDIGGIMNRMAFATSSLLGNGGSAEGIFDAICGDGDKKPGIPNGILLVGEFENYLNGNENVWQARTIIQLNQLWAQGHGMLAMSQRTKTTTRKCDFGYPSMLASTQPSVFARMEKKQIDNGFIRRVLITFIDEKPEERCVPSNGTVDINRILNICNGYRSLEGEATVRPGDFKELGDEFYKTDYSWMTTLANEYCQKFAVLLSCSREQKPEHIEKAKVLARWYSQHIIAAVRTVGGWGDRRTEKHDFLKEKIRARLDELLDGHKDGVTSEQLWGTSSWKNYPLLERKHALEDILAGPGYSSELIGPQGQKRTYYSRKK